MTARGLEVGQSGLQPFGGQAGSLCPRHLKAPYCYGSMGGELAGVFRVGTIRSYSDYYLQLARLRYWRSTMPRPYGLLVTNPPETLRTLGRLIHH